MPRRPSAIIAPEARPSQEDLRFPLEQTLEAVVGLTARVPEDAFTAEILGTEREGSGVLIDERGLVLTAGYLVCEAEQIWLRTAAGDTVPGHLLAYDFESGFGLVQALGRLAAAPAELGRAEDLKIGGRLVLAAAGGIGHALSTVLVGRREFAGYWEYLLDEALFVAPAHPFWGGAGLFDVHGQLVGIGSLLVQSGNDRRPDAANMVLPVDLLLPILDDLVNRGRRRTPPRPWLGLYLAETEGGLVVMATAPGGPAARAGLEAGDRIYEVGDVPVFELADFYRQLWSLAKPGSRVPLRILRDDARLDIAPVTADRESFLKRPRLH